MFNPSVLALSTHVEILIYTEQLPTRDINIRLLLNTVVYIQFSMMKISFMEIIGGRYITFSVISAVFIVHGSSS